MDLIHKYLQFLKHFRILPQPLTPEGIPQRGNTGDDQTYIILCPLQKQLSRFLIKSAASEFKPAKQRCTAHRAHDDTVFDLYIADFPWGE